MYMTAHRVRARNGAEGINVFLHEHIGEEWAGLSFDPPDVALIAESEPGKLVADGYDVPPGGNRVLSFLDVAALDGTALDALRGVLRDLREKVIEVSGYPVSNLSDNIAARFWVGHEHDGPETSPSEFDRLTRRILALAETPREEVVSPRLPLEVFFHVDERGYHFELSLESVRRVREAHRPDRWRKRRIDIPPDTLLNFESMHGDIYPHVATTVTGLRLEAIIKLGGVVFIHQPTGKRVRQWPVE